MLLGGKPASGNSAPKLMQATATTTLELNRSGLRRDRLRSAKRTLDYFGCRWHTVGAEAITQPAYMTPRKALRCRVRLVLRDSPIRLGS